MKMNYMYMYVHVCTRGNQVSTCMYMWLYISFPTTQCDADPEITRRAVQEDKYENILTLIGYYDIESRTPIRLLMLQVFGVLCGLDKDIIGVLLSSILPNEIGRDIQDNLTGQGNECCNINLMYMYIQDNLTGHMPVWMMYVHVHV